MGIVRVAIVGCGRISDLHELGYRGREDAHIVAVCDTKRGRAQEKAKAWGVDKVYTDYRRLLADSEIDLVELLVPHHLHAEMTVTACEAGKHVSVQKPMALTVAGADRMISAEERAGVVLRVYENFLLPAPCARQADDRGRGDRRAADDPFARQHRHTRHCLESAARCLVVAFQRETVRRRPPRLRSWLSSLFPGPLPDGRGGAGLRLSQPRSLDKKGKLGYHLS